MAWRLSAAVVTFERRRRTCQWVVTAAGAGATQTRRFLFVFNVPVQAGALTPTPPPSTRTTALVATAAVVAAGTFSATWWWYGQDSNTFQRQRMGSSVPTTNCEEYLPNFGSSSDPISWHVPREDHDDENGEPSLVLRPLERQPCRWLDGESPPEPDTPDSKSVRAYATSATQFLDRMIEPHDIETASPLDPNTTASPKSVLLATTEAQPQLDKQSRIVHALLDLHHHDDKSNIVTTRKMYFFHSPEIEAWRAEKVRLFRREFHMLILPDTIVKS
jgi:hypothetical protein